MLISSQAQATWTNTSKFIFISDLIEICGLQRSKLMLWSFRAQTRYETFRFMRDTYAYISLARPRPESLQQNCLGQAYLWVNRLLQCRILPNIRLSLCYGLPGTFQTVQPYSKGLIPQKDLYIQQALGLATYVYVLRSKFVCMTQLAWAMGLNQAR